MLRLFFIPSWVGSFAGGAVSAHFGFPEWYWGIPFGILGGLVSFVVWLVAWYTHCWMTGTPPITGMIALFSK